MSVRWWWVVLLGYAACGTEPMSSTSGLFACRVPRTEQALFPDDCPSSSVCCTDGTSSECLPILGVPYQLCDEIVGGQPQRMGSPVCWRASDCLLAIDYNAPYCCPVTADFGACSFDAAPDCLTNSSCTFDSDCAFLPLPATCVNHLCQFVAAGSDLASADLSTPLDMTVPPDLSALPDLTNPDGGFLCRMPSHDELGGLHSGDCASGSYCCANRDESRCIADPYVNTAGDNSCGNSPTYFPTCVDARACKPITTASGTKYSFCCPSYGGPSYCTTGPPYSGCTFLLLNDIAGSCYSNINPDAGDDRCTHDLNVAFNYPGTATCKAYPGYCVVN